MSMAFGPLTDTYGYSITVTSDGSGGLILNCAKYGQLAVSSAQLQNTETAMLVERLCNGQEDVQTNWPNLVSHLAGNG